MREICHDLKNILYYVEGLCEDDKNQPITKIGKELKKIINNMEELKGNDNE